MMWITCIILVLKKSKKMQILFVFLRMKCYAWISGSVGDATQNSHCVNISSIVVWRHQVITWTDVDLSMGFCDLHLEVISLEVLINSIRTDPIDDMLALVRVMA